MRGKRYIYKCNERKRPDFIVLNKCSYIPITQRKRAFRAQWEAEDHS